MPGAAIVVTNAATDSSTIKSELSKVVTCFERAVTMQDRVSKETDSEKILAFAALLSDDILDGFEAFDELLKLYKLDSGLQKLLTEDKKQSDNVVKYARDLEEEAKKQLDRACHHEFVELYKVRRLLSGLTFIMSDLEIILARLKDAQAKIY